MADTLCKRTRASRLNPIISPVGQSDTISQCASLVKAIGHFTAESQGSDLSHMHLLTGTIAAALHFELEANHG